MCRGEDCFVSFLRVREKLHLDFSNAITKYKMGRATNPITFSVSLFHSIRKITYIFYEFYSENIFLNNSQISNHCQKIQKILYNCSTVQAIVLITPCYVHKQTIQVVE